MMNLLLLTKFYPFGTGEAFIENEINVLSKYFEKITVIACEVPQAVTAARPVPDNVKVCRISAGSKKNDALKGVFCLLKANADLKEEKKYCKGPKRRAFLGYFEAKSRRVYEYIKENDFLDGFSDGNYVLYSYWLFMTARAASLIAEDIRPAYMITRAHGYDLYEERNSLNYLPYRRLFLKEFNNVFPCSDNGSEYLRQRYPYISSGVKTSLLGTKDYGVSQPSADGVFRIVSCSRVVPVKRLDRLVKSLALLEDSGLNIEWTHFGGGDDFEQLRQLCADSLKNIRYNLKGDVNNAELMKIYKESPIDLFVNVSSSEGLPVSIMEAVSFSIPVVATDVGGTREIVFDETGVLIPEDFTDESLAGIIKSFADKSRSIDRASCRKFWEKHFTADKNYNEFCEFVLSRAERLEKK
jgi:glycosyltransferase involved in cell wall biosynthesis